MPRKRRKLSEGDLAFVEACLEEMRDGCTVRVSCSPEVAAEIERRWAAELERSAMGGVRASRGGRFR